MKKERNEQQKRMKELIGILQKADEAYYKYDEPRLTDREYDRLYDELLALEKKSGIVLSNSPTQKVSGDILPELVSVRHTKPMLSAGKTRIVEDLVRFAVHKTVMLSWKLDGLTLVLRYANGKLAQAITRGKDGITGEDVTHTVRRFCNVPLAVPTKEPFEVRGEGVISWKDFDELNSRMDEPYRHPRGVAAGSVRKLDATDPKIQRLEFIAFDLITEELGYTDKRDQMEFLRTMGFDTVPFVVLDESANAADIQTAVMTFEPKEYGYPMDGLIMEYTDIAYGKSLGATGHHENRLIALKWEDECFETKFIGIEPAVTKNGMISLTGLFEPVEIDGTMVSRAFLR